jgi:hypothetical protein
MMEKKYRMIQKTYFVKKFFIGYPKYSSLIVSFHLNDKELCTHNPTIVNPGFSFNGIYQKRTNHHGDKKSYYRNPFFIYSFPFSHHALQPQKFILLIGFGSLSGSLKGYATNDPALPLIIINFSFFSREYAMLTAVLLTLKV